MGQQAELSPEPALLALKPKTCARVLVSFTMMAMVSRCGREKEGTRPGTWEPNETARDQTLILSLANK